MEGSPPMRGATPRSARLVAGAAAVVLSVGLLSSCASSDDDKDTPGNAATYETGLVNIPKAGDVKKGGTLSFAGYGEPAEIGRAHVRTPVTNAHLVCRLLVEKKNT